MEPAMSKPLKLGLVGAGPMAKLHLAAFALLPGLTVTKCASRSLEKAQQYGHCERGEVADRRSNGDNLESTVPRLKGFEPVGIVFELVQIDRQPGR